MGYNFEIEYKLGRENMVVDALSILQYKEDLQHKEELVVVYASELNMSSLIQEIKVYEE